MTDAERGKAGRLAARLADLAMKFAPMEAENRALRERCARYEEALREIASVARFGFVCPAIGADGTLLDEYAVVRESHLRTLRDAADKAESALTHPEKDL